MIYKKIKVNQLKGINYELCKLILDITFPINKNIDIIILKEIESNTTIFKLIYREYTLYIINKETQLILYRQNKASHNIYDKITLDCTNTWTLTTVKILIFLHVQMLV